MPRLSLRLGHRFRLQSRRRRRRFLPRQARFRLRRGVDFIVPIGLGGAKWLLLEIPRLLIAIAATVAAASAAPAAATTPFAGMFAALVEALDAILTILALVAITGMGSRRWRAQGLDLDGREPAKD